MAIELDKSIRIISREDFSSKQAIRNLIDQYLEIPCDYIEFIEKYGESEFMWGEYGYLRIWRPEGVVDMDDGYNIRRRLGSCFPFADNGSGKFLAFFRGKILNGIYKISYSDIDSENMIYISNSISDMLLSRNCLLGVEE